MYIVYVALHCINEAKLTQNSCLKLHLCAIYNVIFKSHTVVHMELAE